MEIVFGRMAHPYHLLQEKYEKMHRGRMISENEYLNHLRICGHKLKSEEMQYSERLDLIAFVTMAMHGVPSYNSVALTAVVDIWHVETHSFHLPCGELTITLEDMAMITGLPIRGKPVIRKIESDRFRDMVEELLGVRPPEKVAGKKGSKTGGLKFRDMVEELLGVRPPEKVAGKKGSKTGGLKFSWMETNFGQLPEGADEIMVQQYARAYVMYVFGKVLFADSGGSDVSWMFLPLLRDWERQGSTAGVWSWERLLIGRPMKNPSCVWEFADPGRAPTVTHIYDEVKTSWGPLENLYMQFNLNVICTQDKDMWSNHCPLICFYAIEYHLPHRVARQFGKLQESPPKDVSTSSELHELDRRRNKTVRLAT
ncbi:hypothetical protein ACQ4PT_044474 [Festuca glaucescens]